MRLPQPFGLDDGPRSPGDAAPPPGATSSARPLPAPADLAALDVDAFVRRLDHNLDAISHRSSLASLLPPDEIAHVTRDPRFADIDALFRSTLRGTLVATSFRDLPDAARSHPDVQSRLWSAMDDIDSAALGISRALSTLTPAEQTEISRALRDDPSLGAALLTALDDEAQRAGVSDERRAHLREMGRHASFRLRQSTPAFIAEYTSKVDKARPRDLPEAERYLEAQLGERQFHEQRDWHLAVHREWQSLLAASDRLLASSPDSGSNTDSPPSSGGIDADDAYAPPAGEPPAPPPAPFNPDSGKKVLRVGAWLFGIGAFCGLTGAVLVQARQEEVVLAGLVSFTAAAVLSLGGLLCLLVGAILRLRANSLSRAAYQAEIDTLR